MHNVRFRNVAEPPISTINQPYYIYIYYVQCIDALFFCSTGLNIHRVHHGASLNNPSKLFTSLVGAYHLILQTPPIMAG